MPTLPVALVGGGRAESPAPAVIAPSRSCPRCGGADVVRERSQFVGHLLNCRACRLTFDDKPTPRFDPTGIEYLDRFLAAGGTLDPTNWAYNRFETHTLRHSLVEEYAWAVPNERALRALAGLGPLVEVGAGGGYWAMLLRERGVDVLALDSAPHANHWVKRGWSPVAKGGPRSLARVADRALFLCWPPMSSMAHRCLVHFRGDAVAYIGEHGSGCNASEMFFVTLERLFERVVEVAIPQWPGLHDYLSVWKRRSR